MVEQAQKQIREILGNQIAIPEPYVSAFYDWGDDPYGGGYHAWAGGYRVPRPWDAARRMRKPFPDVPVHICGEAYSDQQAWVEGALCTAELMLQEHFLVTYPADWLPKGYYFGW
jgi:monoamine oxidase